MAAVPPSDAGALKGGGLSPKVLLTDRPSAPEAREAPNDDDPEVIGPRARAVDEVLGRHGCHSATSHSDEYRGGTCCRGPPSFARPEAKGRRENREGAEQEKDRSVVPEWRLQTTSFP